MAYIQTVQVEVDRYTETLSDHDMIGVAGDFAFINAIRHNMRKIREIIRDSFRLECKDLTGYEFHDPNTPWEMLDTDALENEKETSILNKYKLSVYKLEDSLVLEDSKKRQSLTDACRERLVHIRSTLLRLSTEFIRDLRLTFEPRPAPSEEAKGKQNVSSATEEAATENDDGKENTIGSDESQVDTNGDSEEAGYGEEFEKTREAEGDEEAGEEEEAGGEEEAGDGAKDVEGEESVPEGLEKKTRVFAYQRPQHVHKWVVRTTDPTTGVSARACLECSLESEEIDFDF